MLARPMLRAPVPRLGATASVFKLCARPRWLRNILFIFIFVLVAVAAALLFAFVAASTRTASTLVALCEDHIAPQNALVTSGDAAGKELAFLDGRPSNSSDQRSAGRQCHRCRRCQNNNCERE